MAFWKSTAPANCDPLRSTDREKTTFDALTAPSKRHRLHRQGALIDAGPVSVRSPVTVASLRSPAVPCFSVATTASADTSPAAAAAGAPPTNARPPRTAA